MPELPEAETVARTLSPKIIGCKIEDFELLRKQTAHPLSLPFEKLKNLAIEKVGRRGKLVILSLSGQSPKGSLPEFLIFHLRMTGRLLTGAYDQPPNKHTRCLFTLVDPHGIKSRLFFDDMRTFGQVLAASRVELDKWDFWKTLGPEPFEITVPDFINRLGTTKSIKTALLDQRIIAGIGNIYADESLFHAGIHPERLAKNLADVEKKTLLASIKYILKRAIGMGGSSIKDYVDANGNSGSFQKSFAVYGRENQKCVKCGESLKKIRLGGRSTVFCPKCQS